MLSYQQARRVYDRIGSFQDSQAFYEDRATAVLLRCAEFSSAESVFEVGCGTGRFAERLFKQYLSPTARYRGIDLSPKMVGLAQKRLVPYAPRAKVVLTEGGAPIGEPAEAYDRFVSNYVFDLLSEEDIRAVIGEAYRMLKPGGLVGLVSLSTGVGPTSKAFATVWGWIHALQPAVVGGCRPIELLPFLSRSHWEVRQHENIVATAWPSDPACVCMLSRIANSIPPYMPRRRRSASLIPLPISREVTSCTFCSVPDPLRGLRELYRCLMPGGRLLMFEHVRSRVGPIALMQDVMTFITSRIGPDMNRDTVNNVARAGFELCREVNIYLDVVKAIEARRPE